MPSRDVTIVSHVHEEAGAHNSFMQVRVVDSQGSPAVTAEPSTVEGLLLPNFTGPSASDVWRMQLLRIVVGTFQVHASCSADIVRSFQGGDERVRAAVSLFPALPSLAGIPKLLSPLTNHQRSQVQVRPCMWPFTADCRSELLS